ncbi:transposable element Tc1 transposase [Trichonephila clavipes]|uniref:Transposable element Tc1 transposase n=1 Tax=Trichonephila clavipes TaxID=2585209 RepID=A0A8X6RS89_TRICX|nr:transposable element Tc1 transposase [Trichonephila clavipes]
MPCRRKGAKFEQISEFERGKIVGLREAGLSYRAIAARVQRNSSTIMRVSKQWTDEGRTARKSGSVLHQFRYVCCSVGCAQGFLLYRIPLTQNHCHLRLQWANVHRSWSADWLQVVFSDESRFNLWHHDGGIRVRRYSVERHIPECIIERHSRRTPGVMVWGAIAYHGRSQLLRIVGNLNSTQYINEVIQPPNYSFPARIARGLYSSRIMPVHMSPRLSNPYLNSQQVQFLPWLRIRRICHRLNICGLSLGASRS